MFEGPLRLIFFSGHLDSTMVTQSRLSISISESSSNYRQTMQPRFPFPGSPAFLTLTENRYVKIPGSTKTANCSYIERWAANLKESCDNYEAYLRFHGVSSDEVVEGLLAPNTRAIVRE